MEQTDTTNKAIAYISLLGLVIQSSATALTLQYSRTLPGESYLVSTAIVMGELMKVIISIFFFFRQKDSTVLWGKVWTWPKDIWNLVFGNEDSFSLVLPSILYMIQNYLNFLALS